MGMSMSIIYLPVAGITFSIILRAFLSDLDTQKVSAKAWVFMGTATLLWPITLPFIISRKLRTAKSCQPLGEVNKGKSEFGIAGK
jgi:hypothetical protein